MEMKGRDVGIGDFVEHAHGGIADDVVLFLGQDHGFVLLQVVMTVGAPLDQPGGLQIDENGIIIRCPVRREHAHDPHFQRVNTRHIEGELWRGKDMPAGLQLPLLGKVRTDHAVAQPDDLPAGGQPQAAKREVVQLRPHDRCSLRGEAHMQRDRRCARVLPKLGHRTKGQRGQIFAFEVERGHHQIQRTAPRADDLRRGGGAGAELALRVVDQHPQA